MKDAEHTKQSLLEHGRRLFWSQGFSNVSVRQVAQAAQVDVALISRYFGSKQKLFEATMDDLIGFDLAQVSSTEALIDLLVDVFATTPRDDACPSSIQMILLNAGDATVGATVRQCFQAEWQAELERITGDAQSAALLSAAVFGISITEKTLLVQGYPRHDTPEYRALLRHLLSAAAAPRR
ncbi:AcrR family transcriptional regulator [Rubricella aquisinus]|uniref:AcrR family transcriptional regulator n=1 Tax=Rubricella aquisinus TaxID=2028108 RepID=A0A840WZF9_9RHOB|nr:TetR/AcrR family transcriptional regulator [Rubricella aquisinus]MBB5515055.1 AcrR family transcriptional regulator [Rubricella aquisinus]